MIQTVRGRFLGLVAEAEMSAQAEFVDLDPEAGHDISTFARSFDLVVIGHYDPVPTE